MAFREVLNIKPLRRFGPRAPRSAPRSRRPTRTPAARAQTAEFGGGATFGAINEAAQLHGLAMPSGTVGSVGFGAVRGCVGFGAV